MSALSYQSRPALRRPVLLCAFEGFSDAGEAATGAIGYLRETWNAEVFASIDPEDFFDFQAHRPIVRVDDEGMREITWPTTDFASASIPGADRDAVLLLGIEPSMRWPTFCKLVIEVARGCGVELVIELGALLAGRPHTRPIRISGSASTPELTQKFGLTVPRYQGPTGILGALMDFCRKDGLDAVTLWGWVPHYLQAGSSPAASLSLIQRVASLIELPIDLTGLEERSRNHERRIAEAVKADPDIAATVEELERQADADDMDELPSGEELAAEFERFLRDQRRDR